QIDSTRGQAADAQIAGQLSPSGEPPIGRIVPARRESVRRETRRRDSYRSPRPMSPTRPTSLAPDTRSGAARSPAYRSKIRTDLPSFAPRRGNSAARSARGRPAAGAARLRRASVQVAIWRAAVRAEWGGGPDRAVRHRSAGDRRVPTAASAARAPDAKRFGRRFPASPHRRCGPEALRRWKPGRLGTLEGASAEDVQEPRTGV